MPFITRNRKYFNNTYEDIERNTPIFASESEAIGGKDGVTIITNPAFYIMTSTGTNTVSNGYLVTYDLGSNSRGINYINYNPICVANRYPACILNNVQASVDGIRWETISSRFGSRNVNCQLDFPTPNNYRFLRFTTTNDDGNYGHGGVNSFRINYTRSELISSEEGTEDNHNYYVNTDKRLYNFVTSKRHYYRYGNQFNGTVYGNFLRISDGVASGFSSACYLQIPAFTSANITEAQIVFTTGTDISTHQGLFFAGTVDNSSCFIIQGGEVKLNNKNSGSYRSTISMGLAVQPNTRYYFRFEQSGSSITPYLSTDGVTYNQGTKVSRSRNLKNNIGYGLDNDSTNHPFFGKIEVTSETYIKVSGEVWWTGEQAVRAGGQIKDGVAAGFSTANYLDAKFFAPVSNPWEFNTKVRFSTFGDEPMIWSSIANGYGVLLLLSAAAKFRLYVSGNGSSWDIASNITGSYTYLTNTDYYIRVGWDGSEYYAEYSLDGVDYIRDVTLASTKVVYQTGTRSRFGYWSSATYDSPYMTQDFNESYIKINGKEWWHGTKAVEIPASEIDNWGTTRYFKNVVTTKYWKEITTSSKELGYYCWKGANNTGTGGILYTKTLTPVKGDSIYSNDNILGWLGTIPSSVDELVEFPKYIQGVGTDYVNVNTDILGGTASTNYVRYPEGDLYIDTTVTETVEGTPEDYTYTTEESSIIEVTADDDYDYTESTPSDDFDYYLDRIVNYFPIKRSGNAFVPVFESESAGTFNVVLDKSGKYRISIVGGGGAAAMKGVYDDRGYGWSGGSGGAFVGEFELNAGTYSVTVGSANNNTKGQGGNTNTMNPADTSTHDSYITGVVRVGGGGAGTTSGVGAAGAAATLEIEPLKTELNTKGNAGASGSGGKGSGANWTHNGAASVYKGYGKGQGCSTSEYASRRYWIAGTNGYVKIEIWSESEIRSY